MKLDYFREPAGGYKPIGKTSAELTPEEQEFRDNIMYSISDGVTPDYHKTAGCAKPMDEKTRKSILGF